ncbi:MAG: AI-2E family transporter [Lachnospiraceae bacterium]|nr:AI-2E family transporter [Lachnospiraceae bacterium]
MKKFWEDKYIKISVLTVITVAVSYFIILLLSQGGAFLKGLLSFIFWAIGVITPFIVGVVIAYLLLPIVDFFDRILRKVPFFEKNKGLSRGISIFATIFFIFLLIFILLSMIISTITSKIHFISFDDISVLAEYVSSQMVNLYNEIRANLMNYDIVLPSVDFLIGSVKKQITQFDGRKGTDIAFSFGNGVLGAFSIVINVVSSFFFGIIFSIYFLFDTKGMVAYWKRIFKAILGEKAYSVFRTGLLDLDSCFSGYVRGQLADAVFMAFVVTIAFTIAGIPYAALIGIATGVGNLIPYVGPFVAYGMTIICCLLEGEFKLIAVGIIVVFIIQTIDGNIINPRLLSNSIHVHPVLVIVALLFGGAVGGLVGMLIAVPIAAFLRLQFERFVKYREQKQKEKAGCEKP